MPTCRTAYQFRMVDVLKSWSLNLQVSSAHLLNRQLWRCSQRRHSRCRYCQQKKERCHCRRARHFAVAVSC